MPALQTPESVSHQGIPSSVLHLEKMTQNQGNDTYLRLAHMLPGEEAFVIGYEKDQSHYLDRLLAMGLTRGVRLKFLRVAPMGDPVDILVRGYHLSLRKAEAAVLRLGRSAP